MRIPLHFKEDLNLRANPDKIELAKDVGGYYAAQRWIHRGWG